MAELWLQKMRREKRDWRLHELRVAKLPPDYRVVMKLITKYLWNFAGDGRQMIEVLYGIRDLFEEGAASGRPVLAVTGDDVAAFAWNVLMEAQTSTWMGKKAAHLNADVKAALAGQALPDGA